ncbi:MULTISPECIES: SGNH/GDSL hydrolase family protein [unclassified Nocardiopsis]|uniref:SGNH/GDSL hydrolase family protein n=1 Tax=unclassified Nocardiopsis TaxID=2649073 RepID=UPI001F2CC69C|nr:MULTISPECIES: SGNH/GDSL hydrolase family protein [unclassified Nocardiopsis]
MSGFGMNSTDIVSYVALGDSFTEGMSDPYPDSGSVPNGRYRGWADRLAEHLAEHVGEVRYANLAVRGKLIGQIVADQVPRAVELSPDLITLCAGGNDILRPGSDPDAVAVAFAGAVEELSRTGARIVVFTGFDTNWQPVMRHLRGKIATYNMHLRAIADRYGCDVVDVWSMRVLDDPRAWSWDRLHLSAEGHRRMALRVCEVLGVPAEGGWNEPWPPAEARPWHAARQQDLHWAREFLVPWIGRRLTGRSSGDNVSAKRPSLEPLDLRRD